MEVIYTIHIAVCGDKVDKDLRTLSTISDFSPTYMI